MMKVQIYTSLYFYNVETSLIKKEVVTLTCECNPPYQQSFLNKLVKVIIVLLSESEVQHTVTKIRAIQDLLRAFSAMYKFYRLTGNS